ncbi:MAG: flagellar basal body-associated FliL family protein [Rhodobacteraceae bacterium]|nr:flagellar basal body-associated FliL family protein [Paracoccaceae bacterium]
MTEDAPSTGGRKGLLLGLLGAVILGGGGFYAAYSGLIGGAGDAGHDTDSPPVATPADPGIGFVPLDPLVVSLGHAATNRYLRFSAQLEIDQLYREEVELLKPRVLDVLNGFLRAVDSRDIESPESLGWLRAQMLRRVQVVTGEGRVRDLLITEFVLN